MIDNLAQSNAERPRPIIVVYQQAREEEDDATDNVAKLSETSFLAHPVARGLPPVRPLPVEALDRGHLRVARGPGREQGRLLEPFAARKRARRQGVEVV